MKISRIYTPLHLHTDIDSNLHSPDSIVKIPELVRKLKEYGFKSCAITGHDALSGHHRFWNACNDSGIKPLLGWEGYLDLEDGQKYYHILFIAKTLKGLRNLRRLSTKAWLENYYYRPRVKMEWLKDYAEDLIVTDACLGGAIKKYLINFLIAETEGNKLEMKKWHDKVNRLVVEFKTIFGENFYLEIQAGINTDLLKINRRLLKIADFHKVKIVCSSDIHYLRPENQQLHYIFQNSRGDTEREQGDFYSHTYLMTYEEIFNNISNQVGQEKAKEILDNTNEIADKVEIYSIKNKPILPIVKIPDFKIKGIFNQYLESHEYFSKFFNSPFDVDRYWLYLVERGHLDNLNFNYDKYNQIKYIDRINRELEIIWHVSESIEKRVSQYYASMVDNIEIIKESNSLVGIGRGSICGFYTAFATGITQLDPLDYNIPEWRHLDEERPELPDIDLDIEPQLLNVIFEKLENIHGKEKIIRACAFKTITSKSAIQTIGRGLGIDHNITQKISNLIPVDRGKNWTLKECLEGNEEKGYKQIKEIIKYKEQYLNLFDYAEKLEGITIDRSKHASAVFIYDNDFNNYNSAMKTAGGIIVTQLEMDDSTEEGGTKYDFLVTEQQALKHLTLDSIFPGNENINDKYNRYLHPRILDLDDKEIYNNVFHKGRTKTVFQWNSQIGVNALKKLLPNNLTELSAGNNIIRLIGNATDKFIKYKSDPKMFDKDYSFLTVKERNILKDTLKDSYYVAITQEDMMRLSMEVGFTRKDANGLRKAVAKKKPSLMKENKLKLFKVGRSKGFRPLFLLKLWNDFIKPLEGYAFSLNHTYPYSAEGVQDAFLLHKHSLEWYASYLTVASASFDEESEKNKSSDYGKLATVIADIQTEGVQISYPDINKSDYSFKTVEGKILYGLKGLTHVGDTVVDQIINNRPYYSFEDFLTKNVINVSENNKKLEKRTILSLISSGCFDEVEVQKSRKDLVVDYIKLTFSPLKQVDIRQAQELVEFNLIPKETYKDKELTRDYIKENKIRLAEELTKQRMNRQWLEWRKSDIAGTEADWEFNAMNIYIQEHPMIKFKNIIDNFDSLPEQPVYTMESYTDRESGEVRKYRKYEIKKIGGTILNKINKDKKIVILTPTGVVTVKVYDGDWDQFNDILNRGEKIIVYGYRIYDNFRPKIYKQKGVKLNTIMRLDDYCKAIQKM